MQLPPIDRIPNLRPVAVEAASSTSGRVIPTAPVNPAAVTSPDQPPSPGVINMIGSADKTSNGEGIYTSLSDPLRKGANGVDPAADFAEKKPAPEEVKPPPEPPMYQLLMDHLKSLWLASAGAVQVQQDVKDQLQTTPPANRLEASQNLAAMEAFTYSPTKVNKTEKPQS